MTRGRSEPRARVTSVSLLPEILVTGTVPTGVPKGAYSTDAPGARRGCARRRTGRRLRVCGRRRRPDRERPRHPGLRPRYPDRPDAGGARLPAHGLPRGRRLQRRRPSGHSGDASPVEVRHALQPRRLREQRARRLHRRDERDLLRPTAPDHGSAPRLHHRLQPRRPPRRLPGRRRPGQRHGRLSRHAHPLRAWRQARRRDRQPPAVRRSERLGDQSRRRGGGRERRRRAGHLPRTHRRNARERDPAQRRQRPLHARGGLHSRRAARRVLRHPLVDDRRPERRRDAGPRGRRRHEPLPARPHGRVTERRPRPLPQPHCAAAASVPIRLADRPPGGRPQRRRFARSRARLQQAVLHRPLAADPDQRRPRELHRRDRTAAPAAVRQRLRRLLQLDQARRPQRRRPSRHRNGSRDRCRPHLAVLPERWGRPLHRAAREPRLRHGRHVHARRHGRLPRPRHGLRRGEHRDREGGEAVRPPLRHHRPGRLLLVRGRVGHVRADDPPGPAHARHVGPLAGIGLPHSRSGHRLHVRRHDGDRV